MFIHASASTASATTDPFAATMPQTGNGDLVLAFQMTGLGVGTAPAAPTGWLTQDRVAITGFDLACWYRVGNNEPGSYNFNNSGSGLGGKSHVWIISITGAGPAPEANSKASGTGTTATAGSVTSLAAGSQLFGGFGIGASAGGTITPVGFDGSFGQLSATELGLNVATQALSGAGATGVRTATLTGGTLAWLALLVSIPAAVNGSGGGGGSSLGLYHKIRTTGGWVLKKRVGRKLR